MFRFLTIAFFVFAYLNVFSQQNFIITKNNFNVVPRVDTLAQLSSAAIQDFAKPTYGENQTWDYSGIITEGYRNTLSILLSTKLPNTQTDAFFIPNYFEVIAANRGYYFDEYSVVDESGFNVVGWGFDENQNYFIGDLTGNSADSIIFPKQYQTYKSPRVVLKFPSEYGSTHTSSFAKNLKFNLTLTGFGIINGPCEKVSNITQVDKIVGWGKLKVPNFKNINATSKAIDVVLVERQTIREDSLLLYGQPAPPALLGAFGIEQGALTISNRLLFWRADRHAPMMSMYYDHDFEFVTSIYVDTDTDIESSVEDYDNANSKINVFPNPVQNNFKINIPEEIYSQATILTISDINGNIVENITLNGAKDIIEFSTNLSNNSYFVNVFDKNGKLLSTSKFVVNK